LEIERSNFTNRYSAETCNCLQEVRWCNGSVKRRRPWHIRIAGVKAKQELLKGDIVGIGHAKQPGGE
jgi:hypothetical protein